MASEKERTHEHSRSEEKDEKKSGARGHAQDKHDTHDKNASHNKDTGREHESRSQKDSGKNEKSSRSSGSGESRLEAGKSARTTDHNTIRRWVEERNGSPATVKATESGSDPGLLRINFPGYSGKYSLEDIPWEDFFKKFDEKNLEFLYQDETRTGKTSRFFKFVNRRGQGDSDGEKSSRSSHAGERKSEKGSK